MNSWCSAVLAVMSFVVLASCGKTPPAANVAKPAETGDPWVHVSAEKVSYNQGRVLGKNMYDVEFKPDIEAYMAGVKCGLEGTKAKYTEEEMAEAIKQFKAALPSDDKLKRRKAIKEGAAFLEKNRQRKEVTVTASGLQYEVLRAAEGPKPKASDIVTVHYHGTLLDGTTFDSSVERKTPVTFRLDGVIAGWSEGVQLMSKGSKYRFIIPDKLAYGDQGQGTVGPNNTLIFDVELIDINPPNVNLPPAGQ